MDQKFTTHEREHAQKQATSAREGKMILILFRLQDILELCLTSFDTIRLVK